MHNEILFESQKVLLPLVAKFSDKFFLGGGTAIALQLGHRKSVDFDLFCQNSIQGEEIRDILRANHQIQSVLVDLPTELSIVVDNVKISFIKYPFEIVHDIWFEKIISMPDLITLGSMKAYALGRRAKWKDYVDLYFLFEKFGMTEITSKAKNIFGGEFNEKLLREQLCYFDDVDYSEEVVFTTGFEVNDKEVEKKLTKYTLGVK